MTARILCLPDTPRSSSNLSLPSQACFDKGVKTKKVIRHRKTETLRSDPDLFLLPGRDENVHPLRLSERLLYLPTRNSSDCLLDVGHYAALPLPVFSNRLRGHGGARVEGRPRLRGARSQEPSQGMGRVQP